MQRIRLALLSAAVPLICTAVLLVVLVIWQLVGMPDPKETYTLIEHWFNLYGLPFVFLAALLEGIAVINIYIPGSAVIVLGVVFSYGDPSAAALVVGITTVAFIVTAQVNYALGYFGLHNFLRKLGGGALIDRAQTYWEKKGERTLPLAFIHPNVGGFVSIAAGNGRFPWRKFLARSTVYTLGWNILWGLGAYHFAHAVEETITQPSLLLLGLLTWAAISFWITYVRSAR